MMPVAPPALVSPDHGPCRKHHWPTVLSEFQSMPVQAALLTHAARQNSTVVAGFV